MNRVQQIRHEISKLDEELFDIQEACTHPPIVLRVKQTNVCITPEYDSLARQTYRRTSSYTCGLCEKQWTESEEYT